MFEAETIARAVDLQQRSYKLLVWMTDAIERGFIKFEAAHHFATLPAAALHWLESHYNDVPPASRPARDDLRAFCNLFSTYLEGSFDLVENPGKRLYSDDAHCFCPMCSWLIPMPRLRTKKVERADKERARRLQLDAIRQTAAARSQTIEDDVAETLVADAAWRDDLALLAYGHDLLRRLDGVSHGSASLALWRRFAWTPEGSPRHDFALTADKILDAERRLDAELARR